MEIGIWNIWKPAPQPIHNRTFIEARLKDGDHGFWRAHNLDWENKNGWNRHVVAFRIVREFIPN